MSAPNIKQQLGCWFKERWQTEMILRFPQVSRWFGLDWRQIRNRNETIEVDKETGGAFCQWKDSSQLTVTRIFPSVGRRLLNHCLTAWPVRLEFGDDQRTSHNPTVSVLVAIGGSERLNQFEAVLASLRGQAHPAFEIIVVEQSSESELSERIPADIRYVHTFKESDAEFNKSRALNIAASHARGEFLLIHDADYLVPRDYLAECCRVLGQVDGIRPSRFNFHLNRDSTFALTNMREVPTTVTVDHVVQNNPTPLAVRRDVYWKIGGHDESFEGWGGEDVEFLSRLRTRPCIEAGWLPVVHLWHPPAPKKANGNRNGKLQENLLSKPAEERIRALSVISSTKQTR